MSETHKVRTVGDLKKALANFPDDMLVDTDGLAGAGKCIVQECHVMPPVRKRGPYTKTLAGYSMPSEVVCAIGEPEEDDE